MWRFVKVIERQQKIKETREATWEEVQEKRAKIRQQTLERVRKHRAEKQQQEIPQRPRPGYKNSTAKKGGTDKVHAVLPGTPEKKAAILQSVIDNPKTRNILEEKGLIKTFQEDKEVKAVKALATDISEGL